ncbi:MAG: PDZ domain-containing protein [Ginsengibacter sp.]
MKKIFLSGMVALGGLLLSATGFSQTEEKPIQKSEEIIIRADGDNTTKTIVEIDTNNITVNGKPLADYKGNVKIIRRKFMKGNSEDFMRSPGINFKLSDNPNRTFLGVLTDKSDKGALIKNVTKESSAEKAGLKENDVITQMGDKKITSPEDLATTVKTYKPGDEVKITYLREGKKKNTKAVLGKANDFATAYSYKLDPLQMNNFKMPNLPELSGLRGSDFNFYNDSQPKLGIKIQDAEEGNGVTILNVETGSAAEKAGLKKEDLITEMNGEKVSDVNEVRSQVMRSKNEGKVSVKVKRNNADINFEVKIPKQLKTADL